MTATAILAIGLSVLGATLTLWAFQFARASRALRAYRSLISELGAVLQEINGNPAVHRVWRGGFEDSAVLDDIDRRTLETLLRKLFVALGTAFELSQMDPDMAELFDARFERFLCNPRLAPWLKLDSWNLPAEFRSFVEIRLSRANSSGPETSPN